MDSKIELSVRELVEFAERSGDIDNRTARTDPDAMQEGARLHRKIQKEQGSGYSAEVSLKYETVMEYDGETLAYSIEGRADGIFNDSLEESLRKAGKAALVLKTEPEDEEPGFAFLGIENSSFSTDKELYFIDEIKTTYKDVEKSTEPVKVHLAQAKCYAFFYSEQNSLERIGVRMSYANLENESKRFFYYIYIYEELKTWFDTIIREYSKWMAWKKKWERVRNESIKSIPFPFDYREGQKELAVGVYRTIERKKKLFLEAPTGVGKTISTVFPTVKAMGEGLASKIFYGTAKTIARTVAEETFGILMDRGMRLKAVTITAKEKICVLGKPACNPDDCPRAKGHFDRVNDCVYDILNSEERVTRDTILSYAEKYNVCPFEMCLDVTTWADAVVCDYNYLFDPNAYLRRFFADAQNSNFVFLIDEAHNLVERAREMYSALVVKEDFLKVKKMVGTADYRHKRLSGALDKCNKTLLELKRQSDDFAVWEDADVLMDQLLNFMGVYEAMPMDFRVEDPEMLSELYLNVRHFVNMYEVMDDNYSIYSDFSSDGSFNLNLCCMDPSKPLTECLKKGRSAVFFSATLLPVKYYMSQLGGTEEDYAVYAPSPFDKKNRLIMIGRNVSTKYTRRGKDEYLKIARYIRDFSAAKAGNYMVFFPSYKMMLDVADSLRELMGPDLNDIHIKLEDVLMKGNLSESKNTPKLLEESIEKQEMMLTDGIFEKDKKVVIDDSVNANKIISEHETESQILGEEAGTDTKNSGDIVSDIVESIQIEKGKTYLLLQLPSMTETEKEAFLKIFDDTNTGTLIGFCVMGGIFGEGIDLRAERLIGAVIVGTGLPQVCNERELFRNYFDERNGNGFEYAYLYNGMNKVLQSAGRVIRTNDDRGAILLLDERFGTDQYRNLFPQEWYPYETVNEESMKELLKDFWNITKQKMRSIVLT